MLRTNFSTRLLSITCLSLAFIQNFQRNRFRFWLSNLFSIWNYQNDFNFAHLQFQYFDYIICYGLWRLRAMVVRPEWRKPTFGAKVNSDIFTARIQDFKLQNRSKWPQRHLKGHLLPDTLHVLTLYTRIFPTVPKSSISDKWFQSYCITNFSPKILESMKKSEYLSLGSFW